MSDNYHDIPAAIAALRKFTDERDWHSFHTPKNLVMALNVEAAELQEHFQWLTEAESQTLSADKHTEVAHEMADVLAYLLRLSDVLGIDLMAALASKMVLNAQKYPAEQVFGSAKKYTEYKHTKKQADAGVVADPTPRSET